MGARTTEAALRVAEQRRTLGEAIEALDAQVRRDVRGVGSGIKDSASALGGRAVQQAENLPGAEAVREQTSRHPLTALLAGFGAGVALGINGDALMPDARSPREERRRETRSARRNADEGGSGILGMLTGGMLSTVAGPLGGELRAILHEAVTGFLGDREQQRERDDRSAPREERDANGEVPRAA